MSSQWKLIFEFVIYVQTAAKEGDSAGQAGKTKQYSCGWTEASVDNCKKTISLPLDIQGGNPISKLNVDEKSVQQEKGFLKNIFKSDKDKKVARLNVSFRSKEKLNKDFLKLAELLPSTCFVNKSLVPFVVGYRDSAAKKLHI